VSKAFLLNVLLDSRKERMPSFGGVWDDFGVHKQACLNTLEKQNWPDESNA